jgi:hypothetical protein
MSKYRTAEYGFGPLIRLTDPDCWHSAVHVRKAPFGVEIVYADDAGNHRTIGMTRSEVVRLAGMLAEFEIDPTNEAEGYRSKPPTT